jgi:RNA polymerase sigma factor (sigma-70 family)
VDAEQLYREHSALLFRYLLRMTGDAELAADTVQESFLRLMASPPRPEAAKSWLFRVATNLVRERGRTRTRQTRILERFPDRAPNADGPPDPAAEAEAGERRSRARRALDALSERDRTVLLMRAEGFAYREIAEAVGTTTEAMGSILLRALTKFRAQLRSDWEVLP